MITNNKSIIKPKIGFFPFFNSYGDTFPLLKIAKYYEQLGGKTIFFSHGGKYEHLASDIGFKLIKVDPYYKDRTIKEIIAELYFGKNLNNAVEKEIEAFKKAEIKQIVTNYNLSCGISARVVKIPLVFLFSGTLSPPYFESRYATFPDKSENFLTRFVPSYIKNRVFNWYMLRSKLYVRFFNNVAKQYGIKPFNRYLDLVNGDYFLACDDINFLGVKPSANFPKENYVGPILSNNFEFKNSKKINREIERHLNKPGRSILLSMGSSGDKNLFLKILDILNKTNWNIVAIYTNILQEKELPELNDNILLKKFVPSIRKVNELVDLTITHGGRGTIYTAAYSGKPVIGIPMQFEQQYYIDCLIRYSSAIKISRKFFNKKHLLRSINEIFTNYRLYERNAQILAKKLKKTDSIKNTVNRLIKIMEQDS